MALLLLYLLKSPLLAVKVQAGSNLLNYLNIRELLTLPLG